MSQYHVYFTTDALSRRITVDAEDYDEATDKAWDQLPASLCHQCAKEIEISGYWEPYSVEDDAGNILWEKRRY